MINPFNSPFAAVVRAEVLLNSKRAAPYFLILLFTANSILWWGWSVAASYGWGTNSDFNIARNLHGFSFILGLPIFNAIIMGDPIIRDFRAQIDPLIFSKPISRAAYVTGKFCGNFFVLVGCMSAFPLTMFLLQWFPSSRLVVLPIRVFPFFKHFFFFVVIGHLFLAVVYFAAGTLTRNSKIVYAIAGAFYPVYIAYQVLLLKNFPESWRILLDPLMLGSNPMPPDKWHDVVWINEMVIHYSAVMFANRALWILLTAVCLAFVYFRFPIVERPVPQSYSALNLSTAADGVYYSDPPANPSNNHALEHERAELPVIITLTEGIRTNLEKLITALGVEFRLLRGERSVVAVMPLAVLIATLEVAFWRVLPEPSYSASYAGNTAKSLLLLMLGITIFYTGEAMHRDRDQRVEPLLLSQPVPNYVLLLAKFFATLLLTLSLIVLVVVIAILLQALKHNGPIELLAYARIYFVLVVPNAVFLAAAALALNVLIRDRYLNYAFTIGVCAALFYLYTTGHNHWLYNPLLLQLWTYADLSGGANSSVIAWNRIYILAMSSLFVLFAHLCYPRKSGQNRSR
jgi:ABC-type transport system involved in multi-copper enzyme maturation permease subunit